jgi:hypothetical protein
MEPSAGGTRPTENGQSIFAGCRKTEEKRAIARSTREAGLDPDPSFGFLQSCPTLSPGFFVFRIHEAAVRDLRQPANNGP